VVPTGMPLRGPVSEETAGPDGSDPLAVGLVGPLGLCGTVTTAAYVAPPSGDPSCRPPVAASSPVALVYVAGSGAKPIVGCWAPCCGLRRVVRAGQLVGLGCWAPIGGLSLLARWLWLARE